ncbi:MAG: SulP family inorganic anion transporter [Bacteroidales bacterium]|nr:SulP family inorganic anion transporter [Candidatus Cacconaster merdequi]
MGNYSGMTKNVKGDIFGGITAGIVALPLALAFGIQAFGGIDAPGASSLGALAGLVGATMLGFFASLFGGTHSQISGPTGPMTVITASLVSGAWAASNGSLSYVILSMSMAGMFCGLFQILFGVLKIGKYIKYIPYPVLSGFMSGIGFIIILQQIYPLVGLKSPVLVTDMIAGFPKAVSGGVSIPALCLGLGTIVIIYLFPKITKKIPATLVALIAVTIVSLFLNLDEKLTIGNIPAGMPLPFFAKDGISLTGIDWGSMIKSALIPGITLAALGSIDTLLTSIVADSITGTKHESNRELIGQGIGNIAAGLFCGIPGAGATMRTVVNVKSGGRSQLSGMVHAVLLLSILLGLGSLVKYVPLAVLSGILITVGIGIIDFRAFKDIRKVPAADSVIMLVVFAVTVLVDLLTAVAIGVVMACVLLMKQTGDAAEHSFSSDSLSGFDKESPWDDESSMPDEIKHKVYIQRLGGPVFFGSLTGFRNVMGSIPQDVEVVIIRMKRVSFIDQSGLYDFETEIKKLKDRGVTVLMTIIQPQPMKLFRKLGIIPGLVNEDHVFASFEECASYIKNFKF